MRSVSLGDLIDRAVPYDRWRAPLDPRLRRAVILSGFSIATTLVALFFLDRVIDFTYSYSGVFLVLGDQWLGVLFWMRAWQPALITFNLLTAAVYVALLIFTRGLEAGRPEWHWAAFGQVVIGALNALLLMFELAILFVNLLLWALMIIVVVVGIGMASYGASRPRS